MTLGSALVLDRPDLWAALSRMAIDPPEPGLPFEAALAAQQGWTSDFAGRVTDEYRRFLYLAATAGFEVTPSQAIDEAWHLHLALPHYRDILCDRILARPLDHLPGDGTPEDDERCARQYEETLALYERVFEEPAPGDIWPRPVGPEERETSLWDGRGRALGKGAALLSFFAGTWACLLGVADLGVPLIAGGGFLALISFQDRRRRNGGSDCGGADCGGGGSDDGCGSSCGGGCGGGCGGD